MRRRNTEAMEIEKCRYKLGKRDSNFFVDKSSYSREKAAKSKRRTMIESSDVG